MAQAVRSEIDKNDPGRGLDLRKLGMWTFLGSEVFFFGALIVTLLAGRARVSVARYQWRKNSWKPRAEPENMSWEALLASIDGAATLTGEIDSMGHEQIAAARADGLALTVLPASVRLRRAGALAEIAWARLIASRESDDETSDTDPADAAGQERRAAFESSRLAPVYITSKDSPL